MIMKEYNYYLFDFDGTLFDSMHVWKGIRYNFMNELGIKLTEEDKKIFEGLFLRESLLIAIERFGLKQTYEELLEDAKGSYSEEKFIPCPAPVSSLGNGRYMLELWHGPTCAFKDMALQILPHLLSSRFHR